jgi:hypothetical protein
MVKEAMLKQSGTNRRFEALRTDVFGVAWRRKAGS